MSSESRSRIMAKVRHGSRGQEPENIQRELASFGTAPPAPLPHPDVATAFLCSVLKNKGTVDIATDRSGAVKAVARYIYDRYRSQRLVASNDRRLAALPWRDGGLLPRFGELEPGELVALSYARWGVAETGSVITLTGKSNPAANNLLPDDHIVLVDLEDTVLDTEQMWERLNIDMTAQGRPRGINCISGPSGSGDIEGKLVMGAHGPKCWHVILLGNVPASALDEARRLAGIK